MGCRQSVACSPEFAWRQSSPARVMPGERDKSGGPGAACARAADAQRRRRPVGLWVLGVPYRTHILET